jgi:hypothetical protein
LHRQFDKMAVKGVRHMATWEAGFRSFTTRSPMTQPADAVGKKMRVFPNDMIKWIMESIGYEPVVIPVTEVYAAIQQGRVEGQENPIDTIRALRFNEVAPHIVLTQHVYSPLPFVASEALWARLNTTEREQFSRAAREAATLSRKLVREADERNLEAMRAAGAKIIRPDVAAFARPCPVSMPGPKRSTAPMWRPSSGTPEATSWLLQSDWRKALGALCDTLSCHTTWSAFTMPQFAANLSMLYPELDFLDRFEAAAGRRLQGVEYLFPYAYDKAELAAR